MQSSNALHDWCVTDWTHISRLLTIATFSIINPINCIGHWEWRHINSCREVTTGAWKNQWLCIAVRWSLITGKCYLGPQVLLDMTGDWNIPAPLSNLGSSWGLESYTPADAVSTTHRWVSWKPRNILSWTLTWYISTAQTTPSTWMLPLWARHPSSTYPQSILSHR